MTTQRECEMSASACTRSCASLLLLLHFTDNKSVAFQSTSKTEKDNGLYYTPGASALVGDKEEVGTASDFTGVVVDMVATLLDPSSWS